MFYCINFLKMEAFTILSITPGMGILAVVSLEREDMQREARCP